MSKSGDLYHWHRTQKNHVDQNSISHSEVGKNLGQAVNKKIKVEIVYSGGTEAPSRRIIEPHSLYERQGSIYVESYCHLRKEYRTFKIDRIESIKVINSPQEKASVSSPTNSPTYTPVPQSSAARGIPIWLWIAGFFLLLYFCSKFKQQIYKFPKIRIVHTLEGCTIAPTRADHSSNIFLVQYSNVGRLPLILSESQGNM